VPSILAIVQNTPVWVFAIFGLLVWLGAQALRTRTLPLWRLLITPAVFIGWGIVSLALRSAAAPILVADWAIAAVIGAAIGWTTTTGFNRVQIDRARGLVSLPGSTLPLIRNLLIFSAKYGLGAAAAIAPRLQADLAVWDIAVSGASAGYFLAWLTRLAFAYRRKPETPLVMPAQS